ncbi:MAG: response regulator transcription factor [Bacteroidales bacterium]|nr:response regulator transcription factor [Bacteroidales bacterium]
MTPRLIIIDDHPIVARGTANLLSPLSGGECTCAHSGKEALILVQSALRTHPYTLAIVDLELPDTSGTSLISSLRHLAPALRIMVYTMHEQIWVVKELEQLQVDAIIFKSEPTTSLQLAAEACISGLTYRSPRYQALQAETPVSLLSERELDILQLMSYGFTSRAIADRLCLSENTIEYHRKRMMRKLATDNMVELILRAQRQGFLKPNLHHPCKE